MHKLETLRRACAEVSQQHKRRGDAPGWMDGRAEPNYNNYNMVVATRTTFQHPHHL